MRAATRQCTTALHSLQLATAISLLWLSSGAMGSSGPVNSVAKSDSAPAQLAACPSAPHCVSSQASDKDHRVAPLPGAGTPEASHDDMIKVLKSLPRVTVTQNDPRHIHAEFRSRLFRFVDDVDVLIRDDGVMDIRSSSRVGYWDLGVNRKRVDMLRQKLETLEKQDKKPAS